MSEENESSDIFLTLAKNKYKQTLSDYSNIRDSHMIQMAANGMAAVLIGILFRELTVLPVLILLIPIFLIIGSIVLPYRDFRRFAEREVLSSEEILKVFQEGEMNKEERAKDLLRTANHNEKILKVLKANSTWATLLSVGCLLFLLTFLIIEIIPWQYFDCWALFGIIFFF